MSNMDLWNKVCTTDPAATKKLTHGSKLTAIDAYSQIKAATEQFGAVGKGWGWEIMEFQYPPNDTMVVHVHMWHSSGDVPNNSFSVCGQASLMAGKSDNKYPDNDCAKKALTDAITKGLSYLGFNADVFLGKFDDNKYVESLKKGGIEGGVHSSDESGADVFGNVTAIKAELTAFIKNLQASATEKQVLAFKTNYEYTPKGGKSLMDRALHFPATKSWDARVREVFAEMGAKVATTGAG